MARTKYLRYGATTLPYSEITNYNNRSVERYLPVYKRWFKIKYPNGVEIGTYDGGNDSGYYELQIKVPETELFEYLISTKLLEEYGNWSGDYHAYGTIIYDSEYDCFRAEGSESIPSYELFETEI